MTGYISDSAGNEYRLPTLLSWEVCHTSGYAADSFELCCLYAPEMLGPLKAACRFRGAYDGATVFYGVVDEFEIAADGRGMTVSLSGRGLAALLMDNESEASEYVACSIGDILRNHVRPCGITDITCDSMPPIYGYSVASGSSQWRALSLFTQYSAGIEPRFTKEGRLVISSRTGSVLKLDDSSAGYDIGLRVRRYGVISEVLVKNAVMGTSETVKNADFIASGGSAKRVINVPRQTGYSAMRYTGRYQIEQSERDSFELSVTVPKLFAAFPCDVVDVKLPSVGVSGRYKVRSAECWANGTGSGTRLVMAEKI